MCNRTQNDAIWGLIILFLTNQIAGNTSEFKIHSLSCLKIHIWHKTSFLGE